MEARDTVFVIKEVTEKLEYAIRQIEDEKCHLDPDGFQYGWSLTLSQCQTLLINLVHSIRVDEEAKVEFINRWLNSKMFKANEEKKPPMLDLDHEMIEE